MTPNIRHHTASINGIDMHYAEAGAGPLVVLCHGWPELWYSWRYQMAPLAEAGFHVVAPDQRGYGQTSRPEDASEYSQLHLVGDIVGLVRALGEERAIIVGHDFGAAVAWNAALMRPDMFRAVVAMSVPFRPRSETPPMQALRQAASGRFHYMLHVQDEGVAEAEFEADVRGAMRRTFYMKCGEVAADHRWRPVSPRAFSILDGVPDPERLPNWLGEEDIEYFVSEFSRTGFRGAFNWYRSYDLTWAMTAPFAGAVVRQPALYIGGERDPAMEIPGFSQAFEAMPGLLPALEEPVVLLGAGHWVQMERPDEVNRTLIDFMHQLPD